MPYIINEDRHPIPTKTMGSQVLIGRVKRTTDATAVRLDDVTIREITVIALKTNTASVFIGGSDVSTTEFGVELAANESFTFSVNNANMIYIASAVAGEGVSYVAI